MVSWSPPSLIDPQLASHPCFAGQLKGIGTYLLWIATSAQLQVRSCHKPRQLLVSASLTCKPKAWSCMFATSVFVDHRERVKCQLNCHSTSLLALKCARDGIYTHTYTVAIYFSAVVMTLPYILSSLIMATLSNAQSTLLFSCLCNLRELVHILRMKWCEFSSRVFYFKTLLLSWAHWLWPL